MSVGREFHGLHRRAPAGRRRGHGGRRRRARRRCRCRRATGRRGARPANARRWRGHDVGPAGRSRVAGFGDPVRVAGREIDDPRRRGRWCLVLRHHSARDPGALASARRQPQIGKWAAPPIGRTALSVHRTALSRQMRRGRRPRTPRTCRCMPTRHGNRRPAGSSATAPTGGAGGRPGHVARGRRRGRRWTCRTSRRRPRRWTAARRTLGERRTLLRRRPLSVEAQATPGARSTSRGLPGRAGRGAVVPAVPRCTRRYRMRGSAGPGSRSIGHEADRSEQVGAADRGGHPDMMVD